MYVTAGALFLIGIGVGIVVSLLAVIGIALHEYNKDKENE